MEEVDFEGRDCYRLVFFDINVEEMVGSLFGKWREKGIGVVGVEVEDIEVFSGWFKFFVIKYLGCCGRSLL